MMPKSRKSKRVVHSRSCGRTSFGRSAWYSLTANRDIVHSMSRHMLVSRSSFDKVDSKYITRYKIPSTTVYADRFRVYATLKILSEIT